MVFKTTELLPFSNIKLLAHTDHSRYPTDNLDTQVYINNIVAEFSTSLKNRKCEMQSFFYMGKAAAPLGR